MSVSRVSLVVICLAAALALAGCASQPASSSASSQSPSSESPSAVAQPVSSSAEAPASSSSASSSFAAVSDTSWSSIPDTSAIADEVDEVFTKLAKQTKMQVGLAFVDPSTGAQAGLDEHRKMKSASMIKLLIAEAFLQQVKDGKYKLSDKYTLEDTDIVAGTGSLGGRGAGAQVTYGEMIDLMISESDNTAANVLIDEVGMSAINAEADRLGLEETKLKRHMMDEKAVANGLENYTSAADVATLLAMVYDGTFVDEKSSKRVLKALEEQLDDGGIAEGLPKSVMFAHKTGALASVYHDGGIVEAERPYVLVVMCGGDAFSLDAAVDFMDDVSEAVYKRVTE